MEVDGGVAGVRDTWERCGSKIIGATDAGGDVRWSFGLGWVNFERREKL